MEEMKNWADVRWQGYARKNGSKGIRNRILVIYTVKCSEFVARQIAERTNHTDVEVLGFDGCTDNQYAVNLLISLIRHPNVGGVLAVGLGCEYVQPEWLANIASEEDKEASWMFIQQEGGTRKAIEKGIKWVTEALERLKEVPRVEMGLSDLVIGAECGCSDYTSGLAGNVVVGRFYDKLVDLGGTAIFEEIVEAIGLVDLLTSRAVDKKAEEELRYDGASGVGALLEIARLVHQQQPELGIDIIFLDAEDYGAHDQDNEESWCLGAQYWARNPHVQGYNARFGILLDMVGGKNTVFLKESYSEKFAPDVNKKVWKAARKLGYGNLFINEDGGGVTDDHLFINRLARIKTIDIIASDPEGGFTPTWHTLTDNMDHIDKNTLKAVGQTVLEVIYNEK